MTSSIDSTGVFVYVKDTSGTHGNTGEPPASTRTKVNMETPYPKFSKSKMVHMLTIIDDKNKSISKVVSVPRETEGNEKGKGSLSASIVPFESWEICPRKASE